MLQLSSRALGRSWRKSLGVLFGAAVLAMAVEPVCATIHTCTTAAQFKTALTNSVLGDTIILQAGNTFNAYPDSNGFVLPNKTTGSGWITIQSSAVANLEEGKRVTSADLTNMARIETPFNNSPAIKTNDNAHHFKLVGLNFRPGPSLTSIQGMVWFGKNSSAQNSTSLLPNNLVIDRCYFDIDIASQNMVRAVCLDSGAADVTNSFISGCHSTNNSESQAIWANNGTGPYNIINNRLEAAGEQFMCGGATSYIPNVIPADMVFERNHFTTPLAWRGVYGMKNLFELKKGQRVTLKGNIFENCWGPGQNGVAMNIKVANTGSNPWNVTEDVIVQDNLFRHAGEGIQIQGDDWSNGHAGAVRRVTLKNNLLYDISAAAWGGVQGYGFYTSHGPETVTIDHNTVFQDGKAVLADVSTEKTTNFTFQNNLLAHNQYGIWGVGSATGNATLNGFYCTTESPYTPPIYQKNVLVNTNSLGNLLTLYSSYTGGWSPTSLQFPASWTGVVNNQASPGGDFNGYKIVTGSAYDNTGTDGKDIGADIDQVITMTAGVVAGAWPIAHDGLAYETAGGLVGKAGGYGFSGAWTAGTGSPALATGSLAYTSGASLVTVGGKLAPLVNTNAYRNFATAIPTAGKTIWVSFRGVQTGASMPSNHAGFSLYSGTGASGVSLFLGKPGFSATNWGIDHSGTWVQKSGAATAADRDAFLLYRLVFSGGNVTVDMWVDPSLTSGAGSLGTPHATVTKAHSTDFASLRFSVGTNSSNYQFDEFRVGTNIDAVTHKQ